MYKVLSNHEYEIGCDEAGRGCLSGPVVAAAVILGRDFENDIINDSKQLSEKKRNSLVIEHDHLIHRNLTILNYHWNTPHHL